MLTCEVPSRYFFCIGIVLYQTTLVLYAVQKDSLILGIARRCVKTSTRRRKRIDKLSTGTQSKLFMLDLSDFRSF
jgi:hypothetical protein